MASIKSRNPYMVGTPEHHRVEKFLNNVVPQVVERAQMMHAHGEIEKLLDREGYGNVTEYVADLIEGHGALYSAPDRVVIISDHCGNHAVEVRWLTGNTVLAIAMANLA